MQVREQIRPLGDRPASSRTPSPLNGERAGVRGEKLPTPTLPHADFRPTWIAPVPAWRFTWFPVEIEAVPAQASPDLIGRRVAVINGRPETAVRVASALVQSGAQACVFNPAVGDDLTAAAAALAQQAGPFDGIVDLGLEAGFALERASAWEEPMRRTVAMLQSGYETWRAEEDASRLFYLAVTWMDGRMGYGDGAPDEQPLGGLWAGLAKTLPQELPNCNVRVLDLAPDEAGRAEHRIVSELYRWGLFEVGYRQGRRYTLQAQRAGLKANAFRKLRCDGEARRPASFHRGCDIREGHPESLKGLALPATPAVADSEQLGPGDVVLFSGGARGIGLLCARALAEACGATVIVTGREQPADANDPWMKLDDDEFKTYAREQLRQATSQRTPVMIRRELARKQRCRELRTSLADLAARGLAVHYLVCDVTDATAVRRLCDEIGDTLRVVIHNAGVDRPIRLAQKTADQFLDTVRTKVLGFAHLCAAVAGRPRLVQFCNVGSLTGRWGGMTGETDYAAANEALARLGQWARRHALACTVKTVVWPTWESVGMITNFAVTKRYVTPMAADEGIRHWLRELNDRQSGEVMFMGEVGRALTPIQIKGFRPIVDLANLAQLITLHHHAGQPRQFRPFARLSTDYTIDPAQAPFARAFRLDGHPALPASMLLEHACALGAWVGPEDFRALRLTDLTNVRINLEGLRWTDDANSAFQIHSEAVGRWRGDTWEVEVLLRRASTQAELLRLELAYHESVGDPVTLPESIRDLLRSGKLSPAPFTVARRTAWNGLMLPLAHWQAPIVPAGQPAEEGLLLGQVSAAHGADLWALPFPPELRLPIHHLENILRQLWSAQAGSAEATLTHWSIDRIRLGSVQSSRAHWLAQLADRQFSVADRDGNLILEVHGARLEPAGDRRRSADRAPIPTSNPLNHCAPALTEQ